MIKYRIVKKDVVTDGLTENDAHDLIMMQQNADPNGEYELEQYEWNDPKYYKRLGRDPALH